jgi:predicted transposase YbfD/YdcC
MQSTVPATPVATPAAPAPPAAALTVTPGGLAAAFAAVPDPRRQASVDYSLPAILTLAVAAILSAHRSVLAIAEWGARQERELVARLGFPEGRTPCQSTVQRLFRKLDGHALAAALGAHFAPAVAPAPLEPGAVGVALDGKVQRGRLQYQRGGSPVHALTAFCHEHGVVLAHEPIEHGADKSEAELTVAPELIARVDWRGRVLTGDALFCQRHLCRQVLEAGGDYALLVKANQPTLYRDLELLFDPLPDGPPPLPLLDRREARTVETGHGRQADTRHLAASTDLTGYLAWPGLAQVFRLERTWREDGQAKRQLHYGITSLSPAAGPAARLLALKRGHWLIENQLHWSKDVTLGEDASLVHAGQGPTILALLRETALSLLRRAGYRAITSRLRYHSQHPEAAVALLCDAAATHA